MTRHSAVAAPTRANSNVTSRSQLNLQEVKEPESCNISQVRSDTESVIDCSEPVSSRRPSTKHRRNDTKHSKANSDENGGSSIDINENKTKLVFIPRAPKRKPSNQIGDIEQMELESQRDIDSGLPPIVCMLQPWTDSPAKLLLYFHGVGEDIGDVIAET